MCMHNKALFNLKASFKELSHPLESFYFNIFSFSDPIPTELPLRRLDVRLVQNCLQGIQAGLLGTSLQLNSDLVLSEKA